MLKDEIVLINHQGLKLSSGIQIQSPSPPIGMAYIGAYLKQNGLIILVLTLVEKHLLKSGVLNQGQTY